MLKLKKSPLFLATAALASLTLFGCSDNRPKMYNKPFDPAQFSEDIKNVVDQKANRFLINDHFIKSVLSKYKGKIGDTLGKTFFVKKENCSHEGFIGDGYYVKVVDRSCNDALMNFYFNDLNTDTSYGHLAFPKADCFKHKDKGAGLGARDACFTNKELKLDLKQRGLMGIVLGVKKKVVGAIQVYNQMKRLGQMAKPKESE